MKTKARFTLPSLEVMILAQNRRMNVMSFALLELSFILLLHTKTKQNPSLIIGDCLRKIINHPPEKVEMRRRMASERSLPRHSGSTRRPLTLEII